MVITIGIYKSTEGLYELYEERTYINTVEFNYYKKKN